MKKSYWQLTVIAFFFSIGNSFAQCPNQLTNQSSSIVLSPGYPRSGTAATGVQIGASCGLHIVGNLGATYARYEIPINLADNALIPGDQISISMDITNVTANFRYDLRNGGNTIDTSGDPVSGRIITIPSGATSLVIRLFPNNGQSDISGSFDISNLNVSKVGASSNDTQPPIAPTLVETSKAETSVGLNWSATDNVGVTGYTLYQGSNEILTNTTSTSHTVTGLSANTPYNFKVIALDAAGNLSQDSNVLNITTDSPSSSGSTAQQIEYYERKLPLGNPSIGWYKLATFDLAGNGNFNSVVVDAKINYTRTAELGYLANAKLFIREGASQQGKWQYDISGTEIGDYIKYKKVNDTTYELFGYSAGNYGHISIRLAVTREVALNITIPNSPINIADPDVYTTVPLVGKTSFLAGNLGIGTVNPSSLLHVNSQVGQTESLARFQVSDAPSDYMTFTNATGSSGQFIPRITGVHNSDNRYAISLSGTTSEANDNGGNALMNFDARRTNGPIQTRPLFVWTSFSTKYMTMLANGNLGIGTTSPDAKLAVKGNIHAEEVKVDLSVPGPDYVFKEDYDLKSLVEVQNYIKEYGHLPNIPSAKEMETNGIEIGEMNMKLLEKIEELTLYTLEQEKKLEIQKNNNQKLDLEIEGLKKTNKIILQRLHAIENLNNK